LVSLLLVLIPFNDLIGGSIEWNNLLTIGGISGSGKSSIANELETALFDQNPNENFAVLSFNFEMSNKAQVMRKISFKTKMTTSEIKSGLKPITDQEFQKIKDSATSIKDYRIFYAQKPRTPEEMVSIIRQFHAWCKQKFGADCGLVILFDHTRLAKRLGLKERDFFYLGNFRSSRVKKILNLTTFETQNSIYKLEDINENSN